MKKLLPYIAVAFAVLVLLLVLLYAPLKRPRQLDERITLRQHDKIPYGTHVANRLLQATFSKAHTTFDKAPPGFWSGINEDSSGQAVFLISEHFDPAGEELATLSQFIKHGNYVFLITQELSPEATAYFGLGNEKDFFASPSDDTLLVSLQAPFAETRSYVYPGKRFDSYFSNMDSATTVALGTNANGRPNFVQLQSGAGRLFIHLAPLAFSNYFILHKNNIHYFQKVLSLIPEQVHAIVWNEYYLAQHTPKEKEPDVLRVLWQHESFRWALVTAIATLLLYVLLAMRRRQRIIPVYKKPANDSLDFVRTMGRLYYERQDHHNLATKMAAYFKEHVRSRYKLLEAATDETFITELQAKSGYDHEELKKLVHFIQHLDTHTFITEQELARFYQQLDQFYKTTNGAFV